MSSITSVIPALAAFITSSLYFFESSVVVWFPAAQLETDQKRENMCVCLCVCVCVCEREGMFHITLLEASYVISQISK